MAIDQDRLPDATAFAAKLALKRGDNNKQRAFVFPARPGLSSLLHAQALILASNRAAAASASGRLLARENDTRRNLAKVQSADDVVMQQQQLVVVVRLDAH